MAFKTAIVLGSTRGIGRALVKRLAADLGPDSHVYLTARSPSKVGQVAVTRAFARQAIRDGALPEGALINAANPVNAH